MLSSVKEIVKPVSSLSPQELAEFRSWFEEFDAQLWDQQFEEDVKAGKLDILAQQAIQDFKDGNFLEISDIILFK